MNMDIFEEMKSEARKAFFETTPKTVRFTSGDRSDIEFEGLCGFAWLVIQNNRMVLNWFKKNNIGSKHWRKGWSISVYELVSDMPPRMSQSYDRKTAACNAAAAVIKKYVSEGSIYCESRLD